MASRMRLPRSRQEESSIDPHVRPASSPQVPPPASSFRVFRAHPMAARVFSNGRLVDFGFLAREGFGIGRFIQLQGWSYMCKTELAIYPKLVREFYQNLSFDLDSASTVVKGVNIEIDHATLGNILRVPVGGIREDYLDERAHWIETILGIDDAEGIDRIKANSLSIEMRLLHHMICKIFIPRAGSFDVVTERDLCLMYHIVSEIPYDFPNLMLSVMRETMSRAKATLAYGMLLTHIFKFFRIRLKGEEATKLHHTDFYNEHSLRRMGYSKVNGKWTRGRGRADEADEPAEEGPSSPHDEARPSFVPAEEPVVPPVMPFGADYSERSDQRTPVELSQEQLQYIVREITYALSGRSSRDNDSSSGDFMMVSHISTVNKSLSQMMMCLKRLEHSMVILNGRLMQQNMNRQETGSSRDSEEVARMSEEVAQMSEEIRQLRAQNLSLGGRSQKIESSLDILHHMVSKISEQLSSVDVQPPPQPFQPSFSHVHLRSRPSHATSRPPHIYSRPATRGRGVGSSTHPFVVSSSDED